MNRRLFLRFIAMIVAIVCTLAFTTNVSAAGRGAGLEKARAAQEKHTAKMMQKKGVVGTAVGLSANDKPVVLVLLEHGKVADIPGQLDGVKVEKKVTGRFHAYPRPPWAGGGVDPTARFDRPVPIGVSTGHPNITAGTIGCRVKDASGNVYALSNNHVYADENAASIGDAVIQPGRYDGGSSPADDIGTLADFEPIDFAGTNVMDAAIASTTTSLVGVATPSDGYGTPNSASVEALVNMNVQKYGRTTGLTKGAVDGVNATVYVNYDGGTATFVEQIIITPGTFSDGGDSGSLIVTDDGNKNPVGLLFAGSSTMTVANPIGLVLSRFNVTVDDGSGTTENSPPAADFTFTTTDLTADFTDQSADTDGSIASWSWDFGDGDTSTAQNPSHTYAAAGTYTVTLTVTDDDAATDTTSQSVTVSSGTGAATMHVVDLDPAKSLKGRSGNWEVFVTVTILDDSGNLVPNATVFAEWSGDFSGSVSGITASDGTITFTTGTMKGGASVTFDVTGVTHGDLTYAPGDNTDPDQDSDGTTITVTYN